MIIGITGLIGSGKSAVTNMLVAQGFIHLGCSTIIAEEVKKRGLEINRDNLIKIGNEVRKEFGNGEWAKRLIAKIDSKKNYVVEGFRNIAEIDEFKKLENFYLLGVSAGKIRRMNWILSRNKIGDPKNAEEFEKLEKRDFLQGIDYGQQNALCFSMADYYISNEGSLHELSKQLAQFLHSLNKKR